ncbi:MAG: NADH ubiquinone oxidoreductase [Litoreibacter sp.]|nr:NADH ubiquinone oxidoreductase [Litoreibacter sp.]
MQSLFAILLFVAPLVVAAEDIVIENFELRPESRWRFFTDSVMGGVSSGQVDFRKDGNRTYAHMTGRVSTENNGGFIQMRMELPDGAPDGANGVRLIVRGNNQQYFVHLRTAGTRLPWQYYQAGFEVTQDWGEVRLPFDIFRRSGRLLRAIPSADSLKSVAIVAYGRDHYAEIDVREMGFY